MLLWQGYSSSAVYLSVRQLALHVTWVKQVSFFSLLQVNLSQGVSALSPAGWFLSNATSRLDGLGSGGCDRVAELSLEKTTIMQPALILRVDKGMG